jgi:hypothetical protein
MPATKQVSQIDGVVLVRSDASVHRATYTSNQQILAHGELLNCRLVAAITR